MIPVTLRPTDNDTVQYDSTTGHSYIPKSVIMEIILKDGK